MMRKWIVGYVVLLLTLACACVVLAQEKPAAATQGVVNTDPAATTKTPASKTDTPPPSLTDVQKLTFQNKTLKYEIAERTKRQAQSDFEKATADSAALMTELQGMMKGWQVAGYDLNPATLEYTKKAEEPKPAPVSVKK